MRPLYIDSARALSVGLDGPALAVRGLERATGRYPLRLVSRVLVSGPVQWDTPALVECLRRGIPVCFAGADGALVGVCMGMHSDGQSLHERIAEFAARPDWPEHYAVWRLAAERRAILAANLALHLGLRDLRPPAARQAIARRMGALDAGAGKAQRVCGFLESATMGFAARTLEDSGIPPALLVHERDGHNLLRDLGRLLAWDTRVLACRLLASGVQAVSRAALAAAYQRREARQWRLAHDYLALLEGRTIELGYGGA